MIMSVIGLDVVLGMPFESIKKEDGVGEAAHENHQSKCLTT